MEREGEERGTMRLWQEGRVKWNGPHIFHTKVMSLITPKKKQAANGLGKAKTSRKIWAKDHCPNLIRKVIERLSDFLCGAELHRLVTTNDVGQRRWDEQILLLQTQFLPAEKLHSNTTVYRMFNERHPRVSKEIKQQIEAEMRAKKVWSAVRVKRCFDTTDISCFLFAYKFTAKFKILYTANQKWRLSLLMDCMVTTTVWLWAADSVYCVERTLSTGYNTRDMFSAVFRSNTALM